MGFVGLTVVIPAFWFVIPCSVIVMPVFQSNVHTCYRPVQCNIPETIIFVLTTVRTSGTKHAGCDIRIR